MYFGIFYGDIPWKVLKHTRKSTPGLHALEVRSRELLLEALHFLPEKTSVTSSACHLHFSTAKQ